MNFTIERCKQVTITGSPTKLSFKPGKSTAQHNTAVMVFGGEEKTGGEFSPEPVFPMLMVMCFCRVV